MDTEIRLSSLENKIRQLTERIDVLETNLKQTRLKVSKVEKKLTTLWTKVKI